MSTLVNPPGPNPKGPSQKFPYSSQPITNDPKGVDQGHSNSDLDSSKLAQHHTLGAGANQAAPGNHVHDGSTSKQFNDLEILGSLNIGNLLTAGNIVFGRTTITPVANTPTSVTINYNCKGSTFYGFATPLTTVIGSTVLGVAMSSITATSALLWVYRTNTVGTVVFWMVVGL